MAGSSAATRLSLLLLVLAGGCRFAPDLSAYPSCREGACPAGYRCLEAEGVCLPECGERPCEVAPPDGGETADTGPLPLSIATETLPPANVNQPYAQVLQAEGGTPELRFSLVGGAGSLPSGLSLTSAGTLGGTPNTAGSTSFVIQVTDSDVPRQVAAKGYTLAVQPAEGSLLSILTQTLPEGRLSTAYSTSLSATGGTAPLFWSLGSEPLPPGLSLSSATVTGTPSLAGETLIELRVSDSSVPQQTARRSFAIRILPADGTLPSIVTAALPEAVEDLYYLHQLQAEGGVPPYTWGLAAGSSLPPGLGLSAAGALSGTAATPGTVAFSVQVSDAQSSRSTRTLSLTISAAGGGTALSLAASPPPPATVGTSYLHTFEASGGLAPVRFTLTSGSQLPTGVGLSLEGALSGIPANAGSFGFGVEVADSSAPPQKSSASFTLLVQTNGGAETLSITTTTLPDANLATAYSQTLTATGGTAPLTWQATGTLPSGVTLSSAGLLSGAPAEHGEFRFSAKVTDSSPTPQTASRPLSLTVRPSTLAIETEALPAGQFNQAYQAQISASGGTSPYSFSLTSGTLPQGLTLCETSACGTPGRLSGVPKSRAHSAFTLEVSDSATPRAVASK